MEQVKSILNKELEKRECFPAGRYYNFLDNNHIRSIAFSVIVEILQKHNVPFKIQKVSLRGSFGGTVNEIVLQ